MLIRLVLVALLLITGVAVITLHTSENTAAIEVRSESALQNLGVYSKSVAYWAGTHSGSSGQLADTRLTLPEGYTKSHPWIAYAQNGNAWVYLPPGGSYTPQILLRDAGAPGRRLGIKQGTVAKDATGAVVIGADVPIPSGIPDGSAVYLSQLFGTPPAPPPPMATNPTPPPAAPLDINAPAVALVGSPAVVSNPTSWTCCGTPGLPPPPPPPQQPPVNPPPAAITSFNVGIYGGYEWQQGRNPKIGTCKQGSFNTFVTWSVGQGNPADYYTITMSRAGQTVTSTLQHSQIQCSTSCAGNGALVSDAQALAFTPDMPWSSLIYDHTIVNGSSVQIVPWMLDMSVTLKACNAYGCSTTSDSTKDLAIFSTGQRDCQAASTGSSPPWPSTAHP